MWRSFEETTRPPCAQSSGDHCQTPRALRAELAKQNGEHLDFVREAARLLEAHLPALEGSRYESTEQSLGSVMEANP